MGELNCQKTTRRYAYAPSSSADGTSKRCGNQPKTLSKLMGTSLRTTQYAISDLTTEKWIQVVRMNGPGTVSAYIVNDRVAWGQARDQLRLSVFSATVVADIEDQDATTLQHDDLRRIPSLYP